MKKILSLTLCLLLTVATLSACLPETQTASTASPFGENARPLEEKTDNTENEQVSSIPTQSSPSSEDSSEGSAGASTPSGTAPSGSSSSGSSSSGTSSGSSSSGSSGVTSPDGITSVPQGTTVYIYPSGKKYHENSTCSRKDNAPTAIEKSKAESQGYTACKKCY